MVGYDVYLRYRCRVENAEAQIKKIDAATKSLEQALQGHQTQGGAPYMLPLRMIFIFTGYYIVDEAVREIKTKLTKHEEAITLDEKERERQKLEDKKKFDLEEKERYIKVRARIINLIPY